MAEKCEGSETTSRLEGEPAEPPDSDFAGAARGLLPAAAHAVLVHRPELLLELLCSLRGRHPEGSADLLGRPRLSVGSRGRPILLLLFYVCCLKLWFIAVFCGAARNGARRSKSAVKSGGDRPPQKRVGVRLREGIRQP